MMQALLGMQVQPNNFEALCLHLETVRRRIDFFYLAWRCASRMFSTLLSNHVEHERLKRREGCD
jgi:hypothetical protein